MNEPSYTYDEAGDTLSIAFHPTEKATGIELTDHIILHIDKIARRIVRITLLDYSILVQQTEYGARTFPLTGLADLSDAMRELVLDLLRENPTKELLHIAAYTPDKHQIVPVVFVQPIATASEHAK